MSDLLKKAREAAGISRELVRDSVPSAKDSNTKLRLAAIKLRLDVVCDELDALISEIPTPHTILGQGDYERRFSE